MYTDLFPLIGVFNMEELFCGSKDYLDSILSETHFCTLSGTYTMNVILS